MCREKRRPIAGALCAGTAVVAALALHPAQATPVTLTFQYDYLNRYVDSVDRSDPIERLVRVFDRRLDVPGTVTVTFDDSVSGVQPLNQSYASYTLSQVRTLFETGPVAVVSDLTSTLLAARQEYGSPFYNSQAITWESFTDYVDPARADSSTDYFQFNENQQTRRDVRTDNVDGSYRYDRDFWQYRSYVTDQDSGLFSSAADIAAKTGEDLLRRLLDGAFQFQTLSIDWSYTDSYDSAHQQTARVYSNVESAYYIGNVRLARINGTDADSYFSQAPAQVSLPAPLALLSLGLVGIGLQRRSAA